jgi:hypothetical protein
MAGSPMVITLYDPETSEVKATYSRSFVPWRLLKRAITLSAEMGKDGEMSEETVDQLSSLVCDAFGNVFSVQDLNDGADLSEMITVLNMIINKARGTMPANPQKPGSL